MGLWADAGIWQPGGSVEALAACVLYDVGVAESALNGGGGEGCPCREGLIDDRG